LTEKKLKKNSNKKNVKKGDKTPLKTEKSIKSKAASLKKKKTSKIKKQDIDDIKILKKKTRVKKSRQSDNPKKISKKDKEKKSLKINSISGVNKQNEIIESNQEKIDPESLKRGDIPMDIVNHLDEFRSRFLISLVTIVIITLAGFFMADHLLDIINRPYLTTGLKLNIFNLTEGIILKLKASLIAGVLIGLPVICYEIIRYILPAVGLDGRKFIILSIIAAVFLFYGGIVFTYFLILPFAVKMLLSFTPQDMTNVISASKYLSFVILFSLGMGIMFELPIIVMILSRFGIISPALLIQKRKYAIVLIWITAAMITPPDILTQAMLSIPIMILYEISILISKFIIKQNKKRELKEELKNS